MTRDKFIAELNKHLRKAPTQERLDIIAYYNEMFDDRGIYGNAEVPPDIGQPRQIAYEILRDAQIAQSSINDKSTTNIILIIILSILALPIGLPLAIALVALVIAAVVTVLAIIMGIVITFAVSLFANIGLLITKPFSLSALLFTIGGTLLSLGIILLIISFFRWIGRKIAESIRRKSEAKKRNTYYSPYKTGYPGHQSENYQLADHSQTAGNYQTVYNHNSGNYQPVGNYQTAENDNPDNPSKGNKHTDNNNITPNSDTH